MVVPQRWFNGYQGEHNETLAPLQVRRGDLLVHFAGVGDKNERMGYWLDRAEQHLPDWEVEVQHTSYPYEVRDFWNMQRAARAGNAADMLNLRTKAGDLLSQTDMQMNQYRDRLNDESIAQILGNADALKHTLEVELPEMAEIEAGIQNLQTVS